MSTFAALIDRNKELDPSGHRYLRELDCGTSRRGVLEPCRRELPHGPSLRYPFVGRALLSISTIACGPAVACCQSHGLSKVQES